MSFQRGIQELLDKGAGAEELAAYTLAQCKEAEFVIPPKDSNVIFVIDGKEFYVEDTMVAYLLHKGDVFCSECEDVGENGINPTTGIFVNCGDTFAYACSDAEPLPMAEIPVLYKLVRKSLMFGSTIWTMKRRNLKPINPLVERLKKEGLWDEELEALPENRWEFNYANYAAKKEAENNVDKMTFDDIVSLYD